MKLPHCFLFVLLCASACTLGTSAQTPTPNTPMMTPPEQPTAEAAGQIMYYAFMQPGTAQLPVDTVVIIPDTLILVPMTTGQPRTADPAANLRVALAAMFADANNGWTSSGITLEHADVTDGRASVALSGEIRSVGGAVQTATSAQFLLTIFAEPAVQSAVVTLNGESISNLGISHSSQAKPADYVYTAADLDALR